MMCALYDDDDASDDDNDDDDDDDKMMMIAMMTRWSQQDLLASPAVRPGHCSWSTTEHSHFAHL